MRKTVGGTGLGDYQEFIFRHVNLRCLLDI